MAEGLMVAGGSNKNSIFERIQKYFAHSGYGFPFVSTTSSDYINVHASYFYRNSSEPLVMMGICTTQSDRWGWLVIGKTQTSIQGSEVERPSTTITRTYKGKTYYCRMRTDGGSGTNMGGSARINGKSLGFNSSFRCIPTRYGVVSFLQSMDADYIFDFVDAVIP